MRAHHRLAMVMRIHEFDLAVLANTDASLRGLDLAATDALPCLYVFGHCFTKTLYFLNEKLALGGCVCAIVSTWQSVFLFEDHRPHLRKACVDSDEISLIFRHV